MRLSPRSLIAGVSALSGIVMIAISRSMADSIGSRPDAVFRHGPEGFSWGHDLILTLILIVVVPFSTLLGIGAMPVKRKGALRRIVLCVGMALFIVGTFAITSIYSEWKQ